MMGSYANPSFHLSPVSLNVKRKRKPFVVVHDFVSSAKYSILAQNVEELRVRDNSPSVSMWPYLQNSAQARQLNQISIYAERGSSREQARLLYMNECALKIWREMGMTATVVGESHRPPRSALLCFGMPFSE